MLKQQLNLLWILALKDIQLFLADRKAAALCFLVPIILASGFGYVFSKPLQNEEVKLPSWLFAKITALSQSNSQMHF